MVKEKIKVEQIADKLKSRDKDFEKFKDFVEYYILPDTKYLKSIERNRIRNNIRYAENEFVLREFLIKLNIVNIEELKEKYNKSLDIKEELRQENPIEVFTNRQAQVEIFSKKQPIFYDRSGLWWLWDFDLKYWKMVDDIDILNMINKATGADIITSKERNEIINALKQEGRKNIPEDAPKTWIQFKNGIIDINIPEEIIEPSPKYFITNPIPWNYSLKDDTPIMDKIFKEWVGTNNIEQLHEILAFCLIPDYPIHRIFCFIGSGLNGKSCFLEIIRLFIGINNCTSTELDILLNSRFEITKLHKKLVCIMGETNFNEISKTSILKKLCGGDLIGFEYKNKTPFNDKNYAKILIATNNLPTTTDKTIGFYRRWRIIDFINRFDEKKDVLKEIPYIEFENLTKKSIIILRELLNKREFTNEGTIEERQEKYENKSNFFDKFWKEYVIEDYDTYITKKDFKGKFESWCKENRHREMADLTIKKNMIEKGVEESRETMFWIDPGINGEKPRMWVWKGIKWKT